MEMPAIPARGADGTEHGDERGFSLIEVIVASVIAVIAVLGLAHSFGIGRALVDQHECGRDALGLAQERLEYLLNLPATHADLTLGAHDGGTIAINDRVNGTEVWVVGWVDDPADGTGGGDLSGPNDYERITETIGWNQFGSADQIQLSRIILTQ